MADIQIYEKAQVTSLGLTHKVPTSEPSTNAIKHFTLTQLAALFGLDQSLLTSDSPTFAGLTVGSVSNTEIGYLNGVTNAIQTQLNAIKLPNRKTIGVGCDFTTIAAAVTWFNASATNNTEFICDVGTHLIADTITVNNSSYKMKLRGAGFNITYFNASTGLLTKPMFILNTRCDIVDVTLNAKSLATYGNASGENGINVVFTTSNYSEIKNCGITGFNIGVKVTSSAQIIHSNGIVSDCVAKGIEINTTTGCSYKIQDATTFSGNALSIDLLKCNGGGGLNFLLTNASFTIPIAGTGLSYTRADIVYSALNIINCVHTNIGTGTFLSGFDFTNAADCNIEIISCIGEENKKPHAKINSLGNTAATTVTTAGTFYKDAFVNSSSYTTKFTITNNKAVFCSDHSNDVMIFISGSSSVNQNGRTIKYHIRKNSAGTPVDYSQSTVRAATSGAFYPFSFNVYIDDVKKDDYFELFVTSSTNGDLVTSDDINIMIVSM